MTTRLAPTLGPRDGLAEEAELRHAGFRLLPLRLGRQWRGEGGQAGIGDQADGVGDARALAPLVGRRYGPTAVHPQLDRDLGPAGADGPDDAFAHRFHPGAVVGVARPQDRGDELPRLAGEAGL